MLPHAQRRYATVMAIEEVPSASLAQYSDIVERLSCGHLGANHGGTWKGTDAPLARRAAQYTFLIGRKRRCHDCSQLAEEARRKELKD